MNQQPTTAPAVRGIDRACQELLDSRATPTARAMVKKIASKRKAQLDGMCQRAGQLESAFVLITELERYRKLNVYGIDTEASTVSYCIYTLFDNYSKVFDQIGDGLNKDRAGQLIKRCRKLPLL